MSVTDTEEHAAQYNDNQHRSAQPRQSSSLLSPDTDVFGSSIRSMSDSGDVSPTDTAPPLAKPRTNSNSTAPTATATTTPVKNPFNFETKIISPGPAKAVR